MCHVHREIASPLAGRHLETDAKALTKIPVEAEKPRPGSTPTMSVRKAAKTPDESLPMPISEEGLWYGHTSAVYHWERGGGGGDCG